MATTLYQANASVMTSKDIANLYDRTFDKIVAQTNETEVEGSQFYMEQTGNLKDFKMGENSAALELPTAANDTDRIPIRQPLEGFDKTYTAVQRRAGVMVTKDAVASQKTAQLAQLVTGLPVSVSQLLEYSYVIPFNTGFDTETTADGSYMFATDHNYEDIRAGTYATKASAGSAFTTDSFFEAWKNLKRRNNARGFPEPQSPTCVYYPIELQEAVSKVHQSVQYPQNSLNAKLDPLFSAWDMKPSVYLTDTNAWFVCGKNDEMSRGLVMYWKTKPEYEAFSDSLNPRMIWGRSVTLSYALGAQHARNWYGNAGPS